MQMRSVGIMLIACSLAGGAAAVQARELREGDKYMCSRAAGQGTGDQHDSNRAHLHPHLTT